MDKRTLFHFSKSTVLLASFPKPNHLAYVAAVFLACALLGRVLPARAEEECRLSQAVELGKLDRDGIQLTAEQCRVSF